MRGRLIYRHKNCVGFILPDIENSFTGMHYACCPKCGKNKLTNDDCDSNEENITLYIIHNIKTNEYLLVADDDDSARTITFESEEQANGFAEKYHLTDYEVKPNVALYCDNAPVTNGKMIIGGGE